MNGFNSWAQGIIVAIIVSSIIQMILPDNKNKKYVKVVIGVYILFCIISPVVGKNINIAQIDVEEYLNTENISNSKQENTYNASVQDMFKNKVIYNIQAQLEAKGYKSDNIEISIDDEYNITKIEISEVYENKEKKEKNEISINSVQIEIGERPAKRNDCK